MDNLRTLKILLVQEIGTMTAEFLNTLRKTGLDVVGVAETGEDAVKIVSQKQVNVVLLDSRLRVGMTAEQTADELSKASQNIHIIYLTFRKEDLPASSTCPYLLKPFSAEELNRIIKPLWDSNN
jgi:CheY-like chemotaxis protein